MATWRGRSNFGTADAVLVDVTLITGGRSLITGGRSFPMNEPRLRDMTPTVPRCAQAPSAGVAFSTACFFRRLLFHNRNSPQCINVAGTFGGGSHGFPRFARRCGAYGGVVLGALGRGRRPRI